MQQNYLKVFFLSLLLATGLLHAALPATTVWEVRPTVGSDTAASGCFDSTKSGTDYSQQNAAQYSGTNLVSVSSLVVSSATHNFVAADVGNCIQITAGTGFTTGFYEIVSASANQATLDRSPGTAGAGGTFFVGGALATIAQVNTNWTPSNICWVKATGAYTVTSGLVVSIQSFASPGNPASIIGYTATRGDNGQFTWTTATNSINLVNLTSGSTSDINVLFQNINFTTTAGTKGDAIGATSSSVNSVMVTVINCTITGFVVGIEGNPANSYINGLFVINSRITGSTSHGVRNGAHTYILGSMIDNNGGDGFNSTSAAFPNHLPVWIFENSVFYKNGANGINFNGLTDTPNGSQLFMVIISHCDVSTNTGAGALFGNAVDPYAQIYNSIFDANGTYGVAQSTSPSTLITSFLLYNNAFFNNTTAPTLNLAAGIGTITLSASPYTTIGTNFALNNTTGGGKALKAAGFPGVLTNGGGTGYTDVGALQSQASASGGQKGFPIVQ
jgi:hypothetical protein